VTSVDETIWELEEVRGGRPSDADNDSATPIDTEERLVTTRGASDPRRVGCTPASDFASVLTLRPRAPI
jgi:hypothetical protein